MSEYKYLKLSNREDVTIVGFADATILDAFHVGEVSQELYRLIENEKLTRLVVDFSAIKMLSSQTISVLLKMRQMVGEAGGKMVLYGLDPGLYKVFRITRLQDVFEFYDDLEKAVEDVGRGT